MPGHNHLYKLALATAVAGTLLFPSRGYANDVQIFPPQTVAGVACPQGNTLAADLGRYSQRSVFKYSNVQRGIGPRADI